MNITRNQIDDMTLEQRQRLVVDFRRQLTGKDGPVHPIAAKQIQGLLDYTTGLPDFEEPRLYRVRVARVCAVDGIQRKIGEELQITAWEWRALNRFFRPLEEMPEGPPNAI